MLGIITFKDSRRNVFLKWSKSMWREWGETKDRTHDYVKMSHDWLIAPLEEILWKD